MAASPRLTIAKHRMGLMGFKGTPESLMLRSDRGRRRGSRQPTALLQSKDRLFPQPLASRARSPATSRTNERSSAKLASNGKLTGLGWAQPRAAPHGSLPQNLHPSAPKPRANPLKIRQICANPNAAYTKHLSPLSPAISRSFEG